MTIHWVTVFIDLPAPAFDAGSIFWQEVTGYTLSAPRGQTGQFASLVPEGGAPFLRVQRVDDGPVGCHIDLHVDDVAAHCEAAGRLGAAKRQDFGSYTVLSSPAGLPFCFVPDEGDARRPKARAWPGGQRSLVDQVCIDIPPHDYGQESAFWAAITGWPRSSGTGGTGPTPEEPFESLARPPEMPFRFLFQLLDAEEPATAAPTSTWPVTMSCPNSSAMKHWALGSSASSRIGPRCEARPATSTA